MRKYDTKDEQAIGTEAQVREWTRSGLLSKEQEEHILPELKVDLRRTNSFFRAMLFGFGLVIILSFVALFFVTSDMRDEGPIAVVCLIFAAASFGLAEFLITGFRLYRFGIEEAAALTGGGLLAFAAGIFTASLETSRPGEDLILAGLIVGAISGLLIYLRYGYFYAAVISMLCASAAPFATAMPEIAQRFAASGILAIVFVVTRKRKQSAVHAIAWLGVYAYLNLHLSSFAIFQTSTIDGSVYWLTYVAIWVLPAIGLFLALRDRDRSLLDVSIGLGLITLATNKPYIGAVRQTWDPILLGVFLIVTAVVLRRWLSKGDRGGFTAARILSSDKRGLSAVATVSAALQSVPKLPADEVPHPNFEGGGGKSGGAGATGSF